jgi:hypothetical protein
MVMPKRVLLIAVASALTISILASGSALAARGGSGGGAGHNTATIGFATAQALSGEAGPSWGDAVAFAVTANVKERDLYSLWVANVCSQDGVAVHVQAQGVRSGLAGPFTLNWTGGGAAECTAWVWIFPDSGTALSGGSMNYSVGP